eukprot:COSAG04_NODE_17033_length_481_cov_1.010471_1_plen_24_part_10
MEGRPPPPAGGLAQEGSAGTTAAM